MCEGPCDKTHVPYMVRPTACQEGVACSILCTGHTICLMSIARRPCLYTLAVFDNVTGCPQTLGAQLPSV